MYKIIYKKGEKTMTKEQLKYFKGDSMTAPYMDDLRDNKIHIYDVPFQYRTKAAYVAAFMANAVVWDGSEKANAYRLETELIELQAKNDIMEATREGLYSRAESIKMFYRDCILDFRLTDNKGRRLNYDGGYTPED